MVCFTFGFFPVVVLSCFIGYQIRIYTCYQFGTVFKVAGLCWKESFLPCPAVELRRWTFTLLIVCFFIVVHLLYLSFKPLDLNKFLCFNIAYFWTSDPCCYFFESDVTLVY